VAIFYLKEKQMKIDFNDPPEWLNCNCHRCTMLRITVSGSPLVSVCNNCGEVLAGKKDGLPSVLENCPNCEES
jgi:hypothetical protein